MIGYPPGHWYEKWMAEIYRSKEFGGVTNLMGEIVAVSVMTVGYT